MKTALDIKQHNERLCGVMISLPDSKFQEKAHLPQTKPGKSHRDRYEEIVVLIAFPSPHTYRWLWPEILDDKWPKGDRTSPKTKTPLLFVLL